MAPRLDPATSAERKARNYHRTKEDLQASQETHLSYRSSALYLQLDLGEWLEAQTDKVRRHARRQLPRGRKLGYRGASTSIRCILRAVRNAKIDLSEGWEVQRPEDIQDAIVERLESIMTGGAKWDQLIRRLREIEVNLPTDPTPEDILGLL